MVLEKELSEEGNEQEDFVRDLNSLWGGSMPEKPSIIVHILNSGYQTVSI